MNFEELQGAISYYDEILPIGKTVEREGRFYHIVGMTRLEKRVTLYVLEPNIERMEELSEQESVIRVSKRKKVRRKTHRQLQKEVHHESYFMGLSSIQIGDQLLEVEGSQSGALSLYCFGPEGMIDISINTEEFLLFADMIKAGWRIEEDSEFFRKNWEFVLLTKIRFRTEIENLPVWNQQEIRLMRRKNSKQYFLEKRVILTVGKEKKITFFTHEGKSVDCYINKVYPIDVWKENEERFQDSQYRERMLEHISEEELEIVKQQFFQALEQDCPKGMCYLGIEYECTEENISLIFHSREYLQSVPQEHKGSATMLMMLLKPEEPIGTHGLKKKGCIIQTPVLPEVQQLKAELFAYLEIIPEQEESI